MTASQGKGRQPKSVPLSSRRDQLFQPRVPFIAPEELSRLGSFQIIGYNVRRNRRFNREECAFTLHVDEPGDTAAEVLLTLERNDFRDGIGRAFRSLQPGQWLGPLVLVKTEIGDGSGAYWWEFQELDPATGEPMRLQDPAEEGAPPDSATE